LTAGLGDTAVAIEHVGSTAVPGLAAKPVIDIDVVIDTERRLDEAITRLAALGYTHEGDLGVVGRAAFRAPPDAPPHHLYVVVARNDAHSQHIALRDYLRTHPVDAGRYGDLKRSLAERHRNDRAAYTEAKSGMVRELLARAGSRAL
jgi:GrpB-like predicted nucleotidyltransferase (UPF0157 family)